MPVGSTRGSLTAEELAAEAERIARQRVATMDRLTGVSVPPGAKRAAPAASAPKTERTAGPTAASPSRFVEDFGASTPVSRLDADRGSLRGGFLTEPRPTPASPFTRLPDEGRLKQDSLADRAKPAWQKAKQILGRAVRFAKENPGIAAGMAIGAIGGLIVPIPGGLLVGAGLGAVGGAITQLAIRSNRSSAHPAPRSVDTPALRERSTTPSTSRTADRPLPQATHERSLSRQPDGPSRVEGRRAGHTANGEVAAFAALRTTGADRSQSATSDASRVSTARALTSVPTKPGRRMTS